MTSAVPPQPTASERHANPQSSSSALANAASPPSKRDLKSWWKGFKLPSKHQEQIGSATPSFLPFWSSSTPTKQYSTSFVEDIEGQFETLSAALFLLQNIIEEQTGHPANLASAGVDLPGTAAAAGARRGCKGDDLVNVLTWPLQCCVPDLFRATSTVTVTTLTGTETRPQGIFGVPLRQSIQYANVAISLIDERGKSYIYGYVPIVVAKCGVFLKEKATEVEGIFRLAGSEKRIKELKTLFDSPDRYGKGLVWDGYTVHDAANVLRRYLNDLPEPVVPLDLYEKFREPLKGATKQAVGDAEGPQFNENFDMDAAIVKYQQLITELPPLNRQLLLYILDLLAVFAAKADQNRMNSQNLAAIFQPGMLSHPNHAMAPDEYRLNQCVIIFLIENQDHFLMDASTAADEGTVRAVQKGTPLINAPMASGLRERSGIARSASNASAGAESVAKDGQIRRNKSVSSRRSRQSAGAPSPGSPAVATTPTSGLARSNTVPSKRSPALGSGRFTPRHDSSATPVMPLTPVTPSGALTPAPPAVIEDLATPIEKSGFPSASNGFGTSTSATDQAATVARSQDRLLEPNAAEVSTPSRERRIPSLFQRSAAVENEVRQPNKLRKKKLPGSANPSAQSSSASLPYSAAQSPAVEILNPLERIPSPAIIEEQESFREKQPTETPSESTPQASQAPSASSFTPHNLEAKQKSPPTSLHSSFNEGSDFDQIDEFGHPVGGMSYNSEGERKNRWRVPRKKEDVSSNSTASIDSPKLPLGVHTNAEMSSSTVGSTVNRARRSFTVESSDPTIAGTDTPIFGEANGKDGKDDAKGLTGWIKNKYREHKETVEQRRNKSPPADRAVPAGGHVPLTRGKSLDIKHPSDEEKLRAFQ